MGDHSVGQVQASPKSLLQNHIYSFTTAWSLTQMYACVLGKILNNNRLELDMFSQCL